MVATTVPLSASITVAFLLRPLKVKTRLDAAVVQDGIRTLAALGLDLGCLFQGFQIEHGNSILAAVAGKTLAQILRQSDAVDATGVGYLTDNGARRRIDHLDSRGAGNEQFLADRIIG